jgi:hypothetical protein
MYIHFWLNNPRGSVNLFFKQRQLWAYEDHITVHIRETMSEGVKWIKRTHSKTQCCALLNTDMDTCIEARNILTN